MIKIDELFYQKRIVIKHTSIKGIRMKLKYQICVFLILITSVLPVVSQTGTVYNQRDDTYTLLGLKRAKQAYEVARTNYERQVELSKRKLISDAELERSATSLSDAEVNYQQSLLAVLFEKQYITVTEAVKYQSEDGSKHVRLKLVNASGGSAEFKKLVNIEDALFESLQPDIINDIYVSLLNETQTIISQPYEAKIEKLRFGSPVQLDFRLLEDLDIITVSMIYGSGTQRSLKIFLQKDSTVDKVLVYSEQFSQEIELGQEATYDLALELFSGSNQKFSLVVVNLPDQVSRYFKEPLGQARISQVKFAEGAHTKKATLEVSLPSRPTSEVAMNKPIDFYVLVVPQGKHDTIISGSDRHFTEAEIKNMGIGYARLEMIPRGVGQLMVRATQLYKAISKGDKAEVSIELVNEGSQRIDNIEIEVDLPFNWSKTVSADLISKLEIGQEKKVNLTFIPARDTEVGKYDIRIRTTGSSGNQPVLGEDKTVAVEIRSSANIAGTLAVVLMIILLVGGIVIFGIRLSRR